MAIRIDETHDGDSRDTETTSSETRRYIIRGAKTKDEAYGAFYPYILNNHAVLGTKSLRSLYVREDRNDSPSVFHGDCTWEWREKEDSEVPQFSYSSKGGSARVTYGTSIGRYAKNGDPVIPFEGIGASSGDNNGRYEGCEIVVPAWSARVSVVLSDFVANNWNFHALIRSVTGTMNSAVYMGCQPGELLYLGADIDSRYKTDETGRYRVWDVSHEFIGSPNLNNAIIEGMTVTQKRGFDYLWIYYLRGERELDGGKKETIQTARQINVDQVYRETDFSILGLPITG